MSSLTIQFYGERALFRNVGIPGSDVADEDLRRRTSAVKGLIGNILGLWRDFDDEENLGLTPSLEKWWQDHVVELQDIHYEAGENRTIGQHRYKNPGGFMKPDESGPKFLSYHWHVVLTVTLRLDEKGRKELLEAVKQPTGTPYLGQSNCVSQVSLVEDTGSAV